jgi:hypothetical protein
MLLAQSAFTLHVRPVLQSEHAGNVRAGAARVRVARLTGSDTWVQQPFLVDRIRTVGPVARKCCFRLPAILATGVAPVTRSSHEIPHRRSGEREDVFVWKERPVSKLSLVDVRPVAGRSYSCGLRWRSRLPRDEDVHQGSAVDGWGRCRARRQFQHPRSGRRRWQCFGWRRGGQRRRRWRRRRRRHAREFGLVRR